MKIIFLDIDGVICLDRSGRPWTKPFDIYCVEQLNRIVANTGARLVMTSSWRIGKDLPELRWRMLQRSVIGDVCGKTPVISYPKRMDEIDQWLTAEGCALSVTKYVIIDDDADIIDPQRNAVFCTGNDGLTHALADSVIRMLNL